jgi:hypothetical protein
MLSLLIHQAHDPLALARTLGAFVSAAVEGMVLDAAVLPAEAAEPAMLAEVVDAAGAMMLDGASVPVSLRGPALLVARAGEWPAPGCIEALRPWLAMGRPLLMPTATAPGSLIWLARVSPRLPGVSAGTIAVWPASSWRGRPARALTGLPAGARMMPRG